MSRFHNPHINPNIPSNVDSRFGPSSPNMPHPGHGYPQQPGQGYPGPSHMHPQQHMQHVQHMQHMQNQFIQANPGYMNPQQMHPQHMQGMNPQQMHPQHMQGMHPQHQQHPQQYMQHPQQMPQQQMYPHQQMNRPPAYGLQNPNTNNPQYQPNVFSRYDNTSENTQQPPPPKPEVEPVTTFEVNKAENISLPATKVKLTMTQPLSEENIVINTDDIVVDRLCEGIEASIEQHFKIIKSESIKTSVQSVYIADVYYDINLNERLHNLVCGEVDNFGKTLTAAYNASTTQKEIVVYSKLNEYFTNKVNMWLYVNTTTRPNIDSFMNDFSDLIGYLVANEFVTLAPMLEYVEHLKDTWKKVVDFYKPEEDKESTVQYTNLYSKVIIVYLDTLASTLGLKNLTSETPLFINKKPSNNLFLSLCKYVFENTEESEFVLVTAEKEYFTLYKNLNNDYFIVYKNINQ